MNSLIVDDDHLICDLVEYFCSKVEDIKSVTKTNSGFESVNLINRTHFDIIFLDYSLPDINGKDILRLVPEDTAVIMITSHEHFAAESYNFDQIVDFLVKPFEFPRFYRAVQQAKKFHSAGGQPLNQLFVRDGSELIKINLAEVFFFKAEANYISIVLKNRKILTLMTLKELEKKVPYQFQRVHRSYIVNINKIDVIKVNSIKIGEDQIPISGSYKKILLDKINLLD